MIYLLLAAVACVLVPWLTVLLYRLAPRRPTDPLSERELHRLAEQLRPGQLSPVPTGAAAPRTDIARPAEPAAPVAPSPDAGAGGAAPSLPLSTPSYRWLGCITAPLFIVLMLALGAAWVVAFEYLGDARARSFGPGVFVFKPFSYGLVGAVPALFLGIFSTIPVLGLGVRLMLGKRRYLEYLHWDEGRMGARGVNVDRMIRVLSVLAGLVSAGTLIFVVLVMNWYMRLAEDEIAVKRLFALREEVHSYGSVEQVVVSSRRVVGNEEVEGGDLGIRFGDGRMWKTDQTFIMPRDRDEVARLVEFLERKTGKPVTRVEFLTDAPGWEE